MGKKKTQTTAARAQDPTKYYKATYVTADGTRENEVYISDSMEHAQEYAAGPNAYGRQLERVQEYEQFIDSLL